MQNLIEATAVDINNGDLRDKIYTIRGVPVMLDYDLAEYYGYTTKAFNQQVRNNLEKFEGEEFMFQLSRDEVEINLKSKNLTSSWGGVRKWPYAFTEQGIYMLMTVLKGKLATKQSRALVMAFKAMKDYIIESQRTLEYRDNLQLAMKVMENSREIAETRNQLTETKNQIAETRNDLDTKEKELRDELKSTNKTVENISKKLSDVVHKSDISPIMLDFSKETFRKEYILLNGKPTKATETYIDIYSKAKKSIYVIDNYVDIKTLRHLQKVRKNVEIIIFTDNLGNYLHKKDLLDFKKEFPEIKINFIKTNGEVHDRFIIVDLNTKNEIIYHCGASAKDAGRKLLSVITIFSDGLPKQIFKETMEKMKDNGELKLR